MSSELIVDNDVDDDIPDDSDNEDAPARSSIEVSTYPS